MLPQPPRRKPFYAESSFRYLVMAIIVGFGAVATFTFKLRPEARERAARRVRDEQNSSGRPAYVPTPPGTVTDVAFDGVLAKVKDFSEPDDRGEPYGRLLRYLASADPKALPESSVFVDYPLFAQHASDLRGKAVRVTTIFVKSEPLRIERDRLGVEFIHRTYLSDMTGSEGYILDLLEPPPDGVHKWSLVQTDALFLKMASYTGTDDRKVTVPMLLGSRLRMVREKVEADPMNTGTIVVAISALSIMAVIYFSLRLWSRPKPPSFVRTAIPK